MPVDEAIGCKAEVDEAAGEALERAARGADDWADDATSPKTRRDEGEKKEEG